MLQTMRDDPRAAFLFCGAAATCVVVFAVRKYRKTQVARDIERQYQKRKENYPPNTVILHHKDKGLYAPSMSPFPLKLETYLRLAKIPYQNEYTMRLSSKGKTPWIWYNNEEYADSSFCIEFLNKTYGIDLNRHLNKEERAVARSMQKMTEESLYWPFLLHRWVYNTDDYQFMKTVRPGWSTQTLIALSKIRENNARGHGYGRHTRQEVDSIGQKDLQALSDFLGNKHFLMGEQPCEEDCAVFGMLAQIKWHSPGKPMERMMKEELTNLSDYCDRMKWLLWPDWDQCLRKSTD